MMSNNVEKKNAGVQGQTRQESPQIFKKRAGTTDMGKDYEHRYIANLILKLITDDEVENFYLSSNDESYGDFDDVVVEIQFKDRAEIFAIQLKHFMKQNRYVSVTQLEAANGDFSVAKYNKTFQKKIKSLKQSVKMVLFTNSTIKSNEKTIQFKFGEIEECEQHKFIRSSESRGCCYTFQSNESNSKEYEEFFQNLYLYNDQADVQELKNSALETFKTYFCSDETVFDSYLNFITQWSMKEGEKFKLDKIWMKRMIALCVFSPFIKPLSFVANGSVDIKKETLRAAISTFDLTTIEKSNFEKIKSAWSDVVEVLHEVEEANKVNKRYQLIKNGMEKKEILYDVKNALDVSKLMWLLGKCPLVVVGCRQVYEAIKLCQAKNLIILNDPEYFGPKIENLNNTQANSQQQNVLFFQKLSDLKNHKQQLYEKIINNFTYSLDGQKEVHLKHLLEIYEDADDFISANDIVEMLEAPLLIGNQKEKLPPCHIERKLTKILIDTRFLKNIYKNAIALVTCVTDVNSFKRVFQNLVIKEINDVKNIRETKFDDKIYICKNDISQEHFMKLCRENSKKQFHQFRYLDNHHLEWLRSENDRPELGHFNNLRQFRVENEFTEYTIHESEYINNSNQNVNIICADPGMGKSTLMKSSKNNNSSSKWAIIIYAKNHALFFRKQEANMENFLKHILEVTMEKYSNSFHQKVFRAMVENNQIQLIWDGLDEASDATQNAILILVKTFSEIGIKQWLTSRNNLKHKLEIELCTFSRNIKQFNDEEQQEYIKNRLQISEEELSEIFLKIKNNVLSFPNSEILGIPLQIYMLTQLFSENKEKYINYLDGIFTVVDLYEHFVEEKFNVLYREKKEMSLSNEQNYQIFEEEMKTQLNNYKHLAAITYFHYSFMKNIGEFLAKIKNGGDDVGFISSVSSVNDVEFAHNSYGEYFAALYLFENEPSKARDKKFISDSRYNNIRFFLDLMLCKNAKEFIAVIYKNTEILGESADIDLSAKDAIGRNILEVSCAWNRSYPLVYECQLIDNIPEEWNYYDEEVANNLDYNHKYQQFSKFSLEIDACLKNLLLFLPFLIPFYVKEHFTEQNIISIIYYAISFDYPLIFQCIENFSPLKNTFIKIGSENILALALFKRSRRILQKLFSEKRPYFEWDVVNELELSRSEIDELFIFVLQLNEFRTDIPNSRGQLLTHYACENSLIKTLHLLILKGAKFNLPDERGLLPMHYACEGGDLDAVILLLANGAKVDVPDGEGKLPIHHACKAGDLDAVKLLLANGAKVDVPDGKGKLPIHYACKNGKLYTVKLLLANGAKVDVPDGERKLPIHYACKNGKLDTVKLLLANGAKVDVPDGEKKLPIHHACKAGDLDAVKLLLANGAKVDVPDGKGKLPIHYACKNGKLYTVKLLLANGAKVDVPDGERKLPIHYACKNGNLDTVKLLLANGAKVDVPDGERKLPIHYACKNGNLDTVKLLLANGAKVDVPDGERKLPIHHACKAGDLDAVKLLLANGAKVDVPDGERKLPIHYACKNGNLDTVKLLLANGAKVDVPDGERKLPIHHACKAGDLDAVKLLLANGAKVDVPDGKRKLPIHHACKAGDLDAVKLLLANGAKVDVPDGKRKLPIHYACKNGKLDTVKLLLANGAKVDVPDGERKLPIHYACKNGKLYTVKLLLANGAKVDVPDGERKLPIHHACKAGDLDAVKLLLANGAKVDVPDGKRKLPIHYACKNGELDTVKFLLANGVKVDVPDGDGQLPIHYACENGWYGDDIVRFLIKQGEKVDVPDGERKLPIHYACKNGKLDTVKLLLANGVKVDVPDGDGQLPIHYACENGWDGDDIVRFLIKQGAKVDVPDGERKLPIHYACKNGKLDTVKLLLANRVNVDVPDGDGQLPIHYACENEWYGDDIVRFLIKQGAKVDVPDGDGQLPIHYACDNRWYGHVIVRFLIKQGAKVDVPDGERKLPIHYACKNGKLDTVKLLLANRVNVDVPDGDGQLPIHYACENGRYGDDIVRFLIKQGAKVDVPDGEGKLPIHYACKLRSLDTVKLLLANGAKVDVPDGDGQLPIHYACENGWYSDDIVRFLINKVRT